MAPKKVPPLSSLAPRKEDTSIPVTPGSSAFPPASFRPKTLALVLSDGAPVAKVNEALLAWSRDGFGKKIGGQKAPIDKAVEHERLSKEGDVTARLSSLVYELPKGASVDTIRQIEVANKAPHNVPVTTVTRLEKPEFPEPAPAPESTALSYRIVLPTLSKSLKADQGEAEWLTFLARASEKDYVVELDLAPAGEIKNGEEAGLEARRDEVEELIGKSYEKEVGSKPKEEEEQEVLEEEGGDANKALASSAAGAGHGVKIVLDGLAGPPNVASSALLRSQGLENWNSFISRMALHPRVYLKLSPLEFPSVLPLATPSNPVGSAVVGAVHAAANAAASAADALGVTGSGANSSYIERRTELRRRLRTILSLAYEAFGENRIIWATGLDGCGVKPSKGSVEDGAPSPPRGAELVATDEGADDTSTDAAAAAAGAEEDREQLSPAEEWYELCRETFQQIGLGDESLDKIFCENAQDVYRI